GRFSELNSSPSFVDESVNLRVKFGVQERSTFGYIPAYASLSATVTIYPVDNNGIVLTALPVQTLTISYQPDGNPATPYDFNTSIFKHSGYHKYKIHVAPITNAPENIYLEAELNVNRYYEMVQTTPTVLSANYIFYDPISGIESKNPIVNNAGEGVPAVGEIEIAWDYLEGAEEYELEWTWVDNYSTSPGVQIAASAYVFNERMFENNNTRIITQDQNYRIPIVFSQGFLIYRVRGVGRWIDNGFADVNLKKFGAWSTAGSPVTSITAKVSNWPHYIIVDTEHEALKNWQYQAVYAEEGKKKEIISYFDGSLRNRQTVTRINSDNNAVVGESIYDNQGRSAIQILPAPVANPALRYYQKLNVNYALEPYSHRDFDWEPATGGLACVAAASGLSDNIGASKYYSTNNSATGNWQDYVADGEDFPFVQVEYTPDNTGRIRKQSGVGPDYKIDGQHATQYYYLQPFQEELDRLFGYQVGYKSRYKKNLVVDANGQVSISYIDPQGRVIATALAGTNTDAGSPTGTKTNLVSLEDEVSGIHLTVSVDLLNKLGIDLPDSPSDDNLLSASGTNGSENDQLILNTQHASVDNDNPHGFTYRVRSSVFTDCNLSYPFAYDLIIEVRDECGNSMITSTEADKNGVVSTLPDGQIHETVNVAGADYTFTFSSLLDVKSYTISKRLKVDEALLDSYAQDFIANNTCLIPYEEFLQNNVDCDDPLPENEPFMELNTCNISRGMMLGDLSPGGQYGETSGTDPMSVFTLTNVLDKGNISTVKNWQHPVGQYVDAYGNPSYVEVTPDPLNPGQYDLQFTGSAFTVSGQPGWYIYPQQLVNV
ncbi:MAG: hypothetical protein JNJ99_16155, partial [Crocinitomicaceae bacterium]|nr:hypothetical protein [Crocinitomicaceae bacterium]